MMIKHTMKAMRTRFETLYSVVRVMTVTCCVLLAVQMMFLATAGSQGSKPIAVISGTLNVNTGQTVYLNGDLSTDPGGNPLNFTWTLVSSPQGSVATITSSNDKNCSFDADVAGAYKVMLVVNNGFADSKPVYTIITVTEKQYQW